MRKALNILPCKACILSHDFQQTTSMADMLHFAQQNGPRNPTVNQHHYTYIYLHKKDLQQITLPRLHSAYNAQE